MVAVTMEDLLDISKPLAVWAVLAGVIHYIGSLVYNVFFHPLRAYPGPLLWRASRLPFCLRNLGGTLAFDVGAMFERYGPVVRVAPDELAYAGAAAWRDICGHQPGPGGGHDENAKWVPFYRPADDMPQDLISADWATHALIRRQLSHGFSDRAMRDQEPIIRGYVDLLMERLRERCGGGDGGGREAVDLTMWYNYTTFDIIGDLAFGDSFNCLQNSSMHHWVKSMFKLTEMGVWMQSAVHYPTVKNLLLKMIPKHLKMVHKQHTDFAHEKVLKRIEMGASRNDLIGGLLMKQDDWQMPPQDIDSHAQLLIIAGSETTATLLTGATYFLAKNPAALARLTHEVRSAFVSEDEITITSASKLTYMLACLDEALRMYPPVPGGLPRVVAKGGRTLCDRYVPEGTHVGVWSWAASHYSANWTKPFEYHPERFIDGENAEFSGDKREAMQPFSFGPRNCIGRNLAYAEMRTILARLVFNFDIKLDPASEDWIHNQKVLNMWKKPPLWVHLTPRA